jgi:hypothetical protein
MVMKFLYLQHFDLEKAFLLPHGFPLLMPTPLELVKSVDLEQTTNFPFLNHLLGPLQWQLHGVKKKVYAKN